MTSPRFVLLLVSDLFFVSKIRTAAAHLGVEVLASAPARLLDDCRIRRPDLVLVDLNEAAGTLEAVGTLKRDAALAEVRVVGFYAHVDETTRRAALEAGVDEALPRSAFTVRLGALLRGPDVPCGPGTP